MKAIRFHRTGGVDVPAVEDVPTPSPRPGEAPIRIEAAGINFADTIRRRGAPYPSGRLHPSSPAPKWQAGVDPMLRELLT